MSGNPLLATYVPTAATTPSPTSAMTKCRRALSFAFKLFCVDGFCRFASPTFTDVAMSFISFFTADIASADAAPRDQRVASAVMTRLWTNLFSSQTNGESRVAGWRYFAFDALPESRQSLLSELLKKCAFLRAPPSRDARGRAPARRP